MLNQTFNPRSLFSIVSDNDIDKHQLGSDKTSIMTSITSISYEVSQEEFSFKYIGRKVINKKDVYFTENTNEYFAIKKLNHTLRRIYQIKQSNRNEVLKQFIDIVNDGSDYQIIRADIKDFFGEIRRKNLIEKIKKDSLLGSLMIKKLNSLDNFLTSNKCKGLPRGLSISSTLSELYLRSFDNRIKSHPSVYFYARYVDDIIVVCLNKVENVEAVLKKSLDEIGLGVNEKYQVLPSIRMEAEFDYLGVKFKFGNSKTQLLLSSNKVKTIKSRIICSILDYKKNKNEQLLIDRIKFLTSNYKIYTKTESNNLRAGIYYNNQFINKYEQLNELNTFLRKSITAKRGSLSKVTRTIPPHVVSECMKQSFFYGYMNKNIVSFSYSKISEIVRCWKYGK
ncbi:RNA-directed DNA polymerase [Vibrio parahaemolyticus]|nr:RNA-directed DNA polymerase [Vibrio parahaemolyticus]EHU4886120.1 RNA-directed DNA polymerase [Vibrio parahaemolyticus]EIU7850033.1 RNA-directed DNA polymerase [Vibrio parahaemolyticus]EJE8694790.1 RNA-directed DNA polymerase [Vibrio vulnificus]